MKHIVGAAAMKVSRERGDELRTYALGSGLGIAATDAAAEVGAVLHVLLPDSHVDPRRAVANPLLFVDTALPVLLEECYRAGALRERLRLVACGASRTPGCPDGDACDLGARNLIALARVALRAGVALEMRDVGGVAARTMTLKVSTGAVEVRPGPHPAAEDPVYPGPAAGTRRAAGR